MLFNSLQFLIFFIIVFFVYYAIPHKFRWILLLISSYYFYMSWKPEYALLLLFTTAVTYTGSLLIDRYRKYGKLIVVTGSAICILLLICFKYANFLLQSAHMLFSAVAIFPSLEMPVLDIILPIGISFHTFQNMGYLIDVYRKTIPPQKNFARFALFSSYFPQLVAGPIERAGNLLPQLTEEQHFSYENAAYGLRWVLIGLFKKVAVADSVAVFVDKVYDNVTEFTGLPLIIATVLFAFQIYCDFSGYSDIAVGVSKMLGIDLTVNFKSPYLSKSITEFWRRWHVTLSGWFRDYLYIPLGGSRVNLPRHLFNLMVTFVISGLWHGANWTFVAWGAMHGAFMCIEAVIKRVRKTDKLKKLSKSKGLIKTFIVFAVVCFTWIFFRSESLSDAYYVVSNLFTGFQFSFEYFSQSLEAMGLTAFSLPFVILLITLLAAIDVFNKEQDASLLIAKEKRLSRWVFYYVFGVMIIISIIFTSQSQNFIYFQF